MVPSNIEDRIRLEAYFIWHHRTFPRWAFGAQNTPPLPNADAMSDWLQAKQIVEDELSWRLQT